MGVLADGSAWPPIDTSRNLLRTCLQSHLKTSPPTPQKSYPKFQNPTTTFEIFKNKNLKNENAPPRGVSEFFGGLISPFFVKINPL